MSNNINIGLFGFGVAGEGLYRVLQQYPVNGVSIKKICIKNAGKQRSAPASLFTAQKEELLNDAAINVVVEATNDAAAAFAIVSAALRGGKHAVSANKEMIAANFQALQQLQKETGNRLLYEASVCAAIPVIRTLDTYYRFSALHSIRGIVNGSCNYILTKMLREKLSFADALLQARHHGYAESDPARDVDGHDAAAKLQILLAHGFGVNSPAKEILTGGIRNIHAADTAIAQQNGWHIKQVAQVKSIGEEHIAAYVLPQFITGDDPLFHIHNEQNGLTIENNFSEKQFFRGRGAGSLPTASALLNDVLAVRQGYHYNHAKTGNSKITQDVVLNVYCNFYRTRQVPEKLFRAIHEWQMDGERQFITGTVHYNNLVEHNWWRHRDVSLILLPEGYQEKTPVLKKIKKPEACNYVL